MIRADMADAIDMSLRIVRGSNKPFGGAQVIFVGDPYQLPPVIATDEEEKFIKDRYDTEYFFSADAFKREPFPMINLQKVFRQDDPVFKDALDKVRTGAADKSTFETLNSRVVSRTFDYKKKGIVYIALLNKKVATINKQRIHELPGEATEYKAFISGTLSKGEYPNDYVLRLKPKTQVMSLVNRMDRGVVNGSLGEVVELHDNEVYVNFYDHEGSTPTPIEPFTWEKVSYTYNGKGSRMSRNIKGTFKQIPLKAAYAITSHKSQGKTIDRTYIDIQSGIFAPGQLYVALSRATSLEGLHLKRPIKTKDLVVDKRIHYHIKKRFFEI
jgi:ATP-dependent exoDNAse (exonuclease V) alpha subunit